MIVRPQYEDNQVEIRLKTGIGCKLPHNCQLPLLSSMRPRSSKLTACPDPCFRPRRIVHVRLPLAALSGASAAVRWRTQFHLPPLPQDFKQILDDRCNRKSMIVASQLPVSDWLALFRNESIADACMGSSENHIRSERVSPECIVSALLSNFVSIGKNYIDKSFTALSKSAPFIYPFFTLFSGTSATSPIFINPIRSLFIVVGVTKKRICKSFTVSISFGFS